MSAAVLSTGSAAALAARPGARASARRARASVVVRAAAADRQGAVSRRAAASLLALPAALMFPDASRALIPDDDDEELVLKAKANRKSRLAQDKAESKDFIKSEGIQTAQEVNDLVPVQKAIAELAKAGSQLEAGDIGAVSGTVGGAWVKEFKKAAKDLSTSDSAKSSAESVFGHLEMLQKAANSKKTADAKSHFVMLVDSIQSWTADAGIASKLRGL